MSSNHLIQSNSSNFESNYQQYCHTNTRTRSSSSASDDPTRKRMTHLTTRLKNAFRISHQPTPSSSSSSPSPSSHAKDSVFPSSAPMQVRSLSLPSSHKQQQNHYFPSADQLMPKSRPLSCIFEQNTDAGWIQEDAPTNTADDEFKIVQDDAPIANDHAMELDPSSETPTPVPSLLIDDSTCSSTVSEVDSLHSAPMTVEKEEDDEEEDDTFVYEQQTEWINTEKHWFSDYKFPFQSKSSASQDPPPPVIQRPPKQPHEGILKRPTTTTSVLGKRPIPVNTTHTTVPSSVSISSSNNSSGGPFYKKKKRTPVIRFDKMVQVHATYSQQDYNRQSDPDAICSRLNATLAHQIKQELNLYKTTEMSIHEQSKVYTQLFC